MIRAPRSAFSQKRTFGWAAIYVRFTSESGPFSALAFMSAFDPKRTLIRLYGLARLCQNPAFRVRLSFNHEKDKRGGLEH